MSTASIQDYSDVLSAPPGSRPLSSELAEINDAAILAGPHYLHVGNGQFAVVYRCRTVSGKDIAFRCLLLPPSQDAAERATAVSDYLSALPKKPTSFVQYHFVSNAVYAANDWQAAYVMDWIDGITLHKAVQELVANEDRQGLRALADKTSRMVVEIQNAGIAHGDLHPENILVLPSAELRLVDYDSVYVPALSTRPCLVVGPEGYAHPAYVTRSLVRPNNIHMDTFAGLILVASLRMVSNDTALFHRFTRENLLFSAEDIQNPLTSPAFAAAFSQLDAVVVALAHSLQAMCIDPKKAQIPLSHVQGITQERKKAPASRISEPYLPKELSKWNSQPSVAQNTFSTIFQSKASNQP